MALSMAIAVTDFDTRSMKSVRRRLQVSDYFFRNLPPREIQSPTESVASSGYCSTNSVASSSTGSRRQSLTDSLPDLPLVSHAESEAESQLNSRIEKLAETLIESLPELQAESRAETPKVCLEKFSNNHTEYFVKYLRTKYVSQNVPPLRLMYGNRDILNLGANLRKPMWPRIPKDNFEEVRNERGSLYFRLEGDDTEALNGDYPVVQCHDCLFRHPSLLLFNQQDTTNDSTNKNENKPAILCCGRKSANEAHDFRVICKRNRN